MCRGAAAACRAAGCACIDETFRFGRLGTNQVLNALPFKRHQPTTTIWCSSRSKRVAPTTHTRIRDATHPLEESETIQSAVSLGMTNAAFKPDCESFSVFISVPILVCEKLYTCVCQKVIVLRFISVPILVCEKKLWLCLRENNCSCARGSVRSSTHWIGLSKILIVSMSACQLSACATSPKECC